MTKGSQKRTTQLEKVQGMKSGDLEKRTHFVAIARLTGLTLRQSGWIIGWYVR
jgi:hypothetical protein